MRKRSNANSGFTLVEIMIIVVILGVLAVIAIPQFTSSTDDARLSSLDTSLAEMRNAVELYYHQHNSTYPGENRDTDGAPVASAAEAATAFVEQLTKYSSITGQTNNVKNATFKYGPYLKRAQLPMNPFNDMADIECDIATTDITAVASTGATGWRFYTGTGRFLANDGGHDTN